MITNRTSRQTSNQLWNERTEKPLLGAAALFLIVITVPLYYPLLPDPAPLLLGALNVLVWVTFFVDYVVRLRFADRRGHFVRTHLLDLLVLAVPFLRPLRLLRAIGLFGSMTRRAGGRAQGRTTAEIFVAVAALLVLAGGLVLDAERDNGEANIKTPGDALWWAMSTVTTVGYGDRYPTTALGRVAGALLMIVGIALLGVVSGGIATTFIRQFTALEDLDEVLDEAVEDVRAQENLTLLALAELSERLDRLERLLAPPDSPLIHSAGPTPRAMPPR